MTLITGILLLNSIWLLGEPASPPAALHAVPVKEVAIADEFWSPRITTTLKHTIPHIFKMCAETGRLSNFDRAAGQEPREHQGYFFNDSDVYKAIEAAAYALIVQPDTDLEKEMDDLIARIATAQEDDGYLNTYFTLTGEEKWSNLAVKHELYCAGHLIEAGVAYHQATGKRTLLDVATRCADLIAERFGLNGQVGVPGHEEIELALVRLADHTGAERYLHLAEFFLDERGRQTDRELYGEYCQDHAPVREHVRIVGHAVRAMYLYCAMADVAARTGDAGHIAAMERVWNDTVRTKMYITGGIGPSAHNEGFTEAYDLPNDTAYAETCASIGMVLWNHRLNLLHGDARYVDVLERALYNGVLAGISLDGRKFFYTNPLGSRGESERRDWYACACCPPNIARLLLSLGGYVYAHSDDAIYVNLFVGSQARVALPHTTVTLTQKTRYPWGGHVEIKIEPEPAGEFDLLVRVPGWCAEPCLQVNGEFVAPLDIHKGYARLRRSWQAGDVVELDLPMPVQRTEAHPQVAADRGRIALQRGPLVYCLEGSDNSGNARRLALPRNAELGAEHQPELLGGVTVIRGSALTVADEDWRDWQQSLYRPACRARQVELTAVPYYAWANRAPGEMAVWLPESLTLLEPPPVAGINASASHCFHRDTIEALYDRVEPANSGDRSIPRFTWWDRRGAREWVQYDFDVPRRVSWCEVYWYDDEKIGGGCRIPQSWRLFYRAGDEWQPVTNAAGDAVAIDQYNRLRFDAVITSGLKLEVQLQPEYSGGILEWKVDGP
ncbi:MAG: beta-L-arabinofuranosidase domain-containing protein [Planctomycetota bacterium]